MELSKLLEGFHSLKLTILTWLLILSYLYCHFQIRYPKIKSDRKHNAIDDFKIVILYEKKPYIK